MPYKSPKEILENELSRVQDLMKAISILQPRERFIVTKCFGLDGEEPMTLEKIGGTLGVSKERIRQVREVSLSKLVFILSKKKVCLSVRSKKL